MSRASDRAYVEIRSMILSGNARPGEQLKEEQLAEICGVSRTPVRDAMRRLEADLYIVRNDSQRAFVANWSRAEVEESFTLRSMLEAHAASRAATRLDSTGLTRLKECNAAIEAAVFRRDPDVAAFLDGNSEFHRIIVETAQSDRLAGILRTLVEQPVVRRTAVRYGPAQLARSVSEHRELIQAFEARDPDWAKAVMMAHIRRAFHVFAGTLAQVDQAERER